MTDILIFLLAVSEVVIDPSRRRSCLTGVCPDIQCRWVLISVVRRSHLLLEQALTSQRSVCQTSDAEGGPL